MRHVVMPGLSANNIWLRDSSRRLILGAIAAMGAPLVARCAFLEYAVDAVKGVRN